MDSDSLKELNANISVSHYGGNYDNLLRFISYYYQIDITRNLYADKYRILEIGIGNKTVTNYLTHHNFHLTTCDNNPSLNPDSVADIRWLPYSDNSFEIVLAFEIIEHLPWQNTDEVLQELARVSNKYVVMSIPNMTVSFEVIFKSSLLKRIVGKRFFDFFFQIPFFWWDVKLTESHHWEMGTKNYSFRKVRRKLSKYFTIEEEIRPVMQTYHRFFVLKKRG